MRVLFSVSSWPTHYASMVPIGWAAQAAGHEVRVLCAPSQVEPVARAGLFPVPVLDGLDVVVANRLRNYQEAARGEWPYPWLPPHPLTGAPLRDLADFDLDRHHRETAPALAARAANGFDRAVAYARAWRADLVLHDPASLEGLLAAHVTGVPGVVCLWGPAGTHETRRARIVPSDPSGSFPRHGLGEFHPDLMRHAIDPCPAALAPPTSAVRLPMRYLPYNGVRAVPDWLSDEPRRPRVCVVWSTALSMTVGPNSFALPELTRALSGLDVEVVVTATAADLAALGPVGPRVRALDRLPLRLLLPSCAAVVHHGGAGNAMTALWAGTPQLAVTFASEQTLTGERVAATGAGAQVLGHQADRPTIRALTARLIDDDSYRASAGKLRAEMLGRPTPAAVVATLERMACEV